MVKVAWLNSKQSNDYAKSQVIFGVTLSALLWQSWRTMILLSHLFTTLYVAFSRRAKITMLKIIRRKPIAHVYS